MCLKLIQLQDGVFTSKGGAAVNGVGLASEQDSWSKALIYKAGAVVRDETVRNAEVIERRFCPDLYESIEAEIVTDLFRQVRATLGVQFDGMEGSQIVRYKPGGAFQPHVDSGRTYPERVVSVIKYLSSDYCGGATFFPDLGVEVGSIAPEFLIFFPELLHGSKPVASGEKLVFVTWLTKAPIRWL